MIDMEKIVKAIEICYTPGNNCTECPFFHKEECNNDLMRDTLELLKDDETQLIYRDEIINAYEKDQKPAKPKQPLAADDPFWLCGNCGKEIESTMFRYCPYCGKAVKWE